MVKKMKIVKKAFAIAVAAITVTLTATGVCADSIYYDAGGCYYTFINNDKVALTGWDYRTSVIKVPDTLNGRAVASVASHAFYEDTQITGVDFSDANHIETIGKYSFAKCTSLSEPLTIPESVTTLGDSAFEKSGVTEVVLNCSADYIPTQCFYRCDSLTEVTINGAAERIGTYAFGSCPNLEFVSIPESVTDIDSSAFDNCPNLTLRVYYGSYAHQFAKANGLTYDFLDDYIKGDADMNGVVNVNDVTAIQRHVAEFELLNELQVKAADVTGDGGLAVADATYLQRYLAEYADAVL